MVETLTLTIDDVAADWPVPGRKDHKYTRGVVGVVAGTSRYPGAAVLATSAAVLAGAGMVRYQGCDDAARMVLAARPEVVLADGRVNAWVLGPGVIEKRLDETRDEHSQREKCWALLGVASGMLGGAVKPVPAVIDAGALTLVDRPLPPSVVLTPHAGELATMLSARGEQVVRAVIEADPVRWARRIHEVTGATVLLKGATTVVAGPGGAYVQENAPHWLATAGTGDVLAGLLGTMLAQRSAEVMVYPTLAARLAAAATLIHGLAAHRANPGGPVSALAVAQALPGTIAEVMRQRV
ncbi:MAG: NAD(P)H-hydrate dehydratase [Promicromonosporaceae bacterium]|nr:NAD(P)H-hydrate dehydratase [Promicromonosporaceae bacterium]